MLEKYQYAHIHTFGVKIASCFAQIFQRSVSSLPELGVNLTGQRAWVIALEQKQGCKQGAEKFVLKSLKLQNYSDFQERLMISVFLGQAVFTSRVQGLTPAP